MEVLNYTGKDLGVFTKSGTPFTVLFSVGHAQLNHEYVLAMETDMLVPIYRKEYFGVNGLPDPDPNRQKYYVVNEDIMNALGKIRNDLLLPTGPVAHKGATFYKNLILAN